MSRIVASVVVLLLSNGLVSPPAIVTHDNQAIAGVLQDGVRSVRLRVEPGSWRPELDEGPAHEVLAFGEEGKALQNPGPLLRGEVGTTFEVVIRNTTSDTLTVHGLHDRPGPAQPLRVAPSSTGTARFNVRLPGTYFYWATTDGATLPNRRGLDSQLSGALVIDSVGGRTDDRIFVIGIEAGPGAVSALRQLRAVVVNGRSWPHTTRLQGNVGQPMQMRWINASERSHPLHLHGFYFNVQSRGDRNADTVYAAGLQRQVATEFMAQGTTMRMEWTPERGGNWLLHCHMLEHVGPHLRLGPHKAHGENHTIDVMSGLVVGIHVQPVPAEAPTSELVRRRIRLLAQQRERVHGSQPGMGFVVGGLPAPAADSITIPGSPLILTRGEPVEITVVNRLSEPTSVHWHGIELDSYYDGVSGWSGSPGRLAPAVAAGDSFVVRFTPPRAGTFIYHTHFDEDRQLKSGLYGPLIVVEPGQQFDPERERVLLFSAAGPVPQSNVWLNGSATPRMEFRAGRQYRIRLINIHANAPLSITLAEDTIPVSWRAIAKDGRDLPPAQATTRRASVRMGVGETYDFEWVASSTGALRIEAYTADRRLGLTVPVTLR